jgi:hypothetical protein
MATAGSKVQDNKGEQKQRYANVHVFPDGSSIEVYASPDNQRLRIRHSSGSHLEFKADGSVFLKAMKDFHAHTSAMSKQNQEQKGSDKTTNRIDTDYVLDVRGRLFINCAELNMEVGSTARISAGTDLIMSANNTIMKDTESMSIEPMKSLYIDTKEVRERVVQKTTYEGTDEDGKPGGGQILKMDGKSVIINDDENGGISIITKGYLNFVCGQERIDIVGKYTEKPESKAQATWTQIVDKPEPASNQNKSKEPGGDLYLETYSTYVEKICTDEEDSRYTPNGHLVEVTKGDEKTQVMEGDKILIVKEGDMYKTVKQGKYESKVKKDEKWEVEGERSRKVKKNEKVEIQGQQKIKAKKIFLN